MCEKSKICLKYKHLKAQTHRYTLAGVCMERGVYERSLLNVGLEPFEGVYGDLSSSSYGESSRAFIR